MPDSPRSESMKRILVPAALALATTVASTAASAQEVTVQTGSNVLHTPTEHTHWEIELHGLFPYYYGYGVGGGARLNAPILASGFGHSLNNSFGFSVGADGYYGW